jgi:hypothetical protein
MTGQGTSPSLPNVARAGRSARAFGPSAKLICGGFEHASRYEREQLAHDLAEDRRCGLDAQPSPDVHGGAGADLSVPWLR